MLTFSQSFYLEEFLFFFLDEQLKFTSSFRSFYYFNSTFYRYINSFRYYHIVSYRVKNPYFNLIKTLKYLRNKNEKVDYFYKKKIHLSSTTEKFSQRKKKRKCKVSDIRERSVEYYAQVHPL